jgi:hypothetical protein
MDERLTDVEIEHAASDQAVVVFRGEHDVAEGDALREMLWRLVSEYDLVVADFAEAAFVDSVVIDVLLETKREASARLHRFRVQLSTESRVERFAAGDPASAAWPPSRRVATPIVRVRQACRR